jgi:hypothetical protein
MVRRGRKVEVEELAGRKVEVKGLGLRAESGDQS